MLNFASSTACFCRQTGSSYKLPHSSKPTKELMDWTKNYDVGGCSTESDAGETDPLKLSRAAVAAGSKEPFNAGSEWDALDEKVRVIATQDGLAAYKF